VRASDEVEVENELEEDEQQHHQQQKNESVPQKVHQLEFISCRNRAATCEEVNKLLYNISSKLNKCSYSLLGDAANRAARAATEAEVLVPIPPPPRHRHRFRFGMV
jgi:hypothetical protein